MLITNDFYVDTFLCGQVLNTSAHNVSIDVDIFLIVWYNVYDKTLRRICMNNKIGLVLSGGGAKGSYEIGVFKALEQLGADKYITDIAGTSVGALNAALLETKGGSYAEDLWMKLKFSDLLHFDVSKIPLIGKLGTPNTSPYVKSEIYSSPSGGVMEEYIQPLKDFVTNGLPISQKKIAELIDSHINFYRIRRNIYIMCSQLGGKLTCFTLNHYAPTMQKQIILASSALPGIYRGIVGVEVNGEYYFDGGVTDEGNTPVSYIYERGCRQIIVVHLRSNTYTYDPIKYPDANIINIRPSRSLGGFLTGTLNLNRPKVREDIDLGYNDTMNLQNQIYDMMNTVR